MNIPQCYPQQRKLYAEINMAHKAIQHLAVIIILVALIIILYGKFFLNRNDNVFLLVYGTLVTLGIFILFFISHRYVDPKEEIIKNKLNAGKKKPFVSCVVAVHNEEHLIERCIKSLLNSNYPNKEIIIINDASTDKTSKVLLQFQANPLVTIIDLKRNVGKKKAIADGLKVAKGEFYVFTDSDSILEPTAISKIMEIFIHDEQIGAVSGHGRALNADKNTITRIQDSWYDGQFGIKKAFESVYGAVTCVSGPLAVFRKAAIFNYIPAWSNDTFLGKEFKFSTDRTLTSFALGGKYIGPKIKKKYHDSWFVQSQNYPDREWKVIYCKSAKVWTNVPETFGKMLHQQIRWKKSFIRSIFLTGRFYWRKPLIAALRYYFTILFVLTAPFIVFRQLIYQPWHGNYIAPILYIAGVLFIGSVYAIAYKLDNPRCHRWVYRPVMSIMSTMIFSWLVYYSLATIRKSIWRRG